ncbi:hypothetical protein FE257_007902 [Aspergillus nanangensis]|uniref:Uncharacterized protein n=1 Tax=Aspergillus nanangensis TaxID=2582783 RepID=A0AAD4CX90_ASPNN|nr:hypothetical protein FE257_007902 [Aspergillus nanangensis]
MHWEYRTVSSRAPRSFIFTVVANVGPNGARRPLAVAYRQHHDKCNRDGSWPRVNHMVTDTLALIDTLSDPVNRAPLEAERALAADWYRRSPQEPPIQERPSIPDTPQPPFVPWDHRREPVHQQAPLPWREDGLQFPFIATCVLLALLRDDRAGNATGPRDIQFQPLSTVFRADCTEYGLVVLDISDLDHVKYGIVASPVDYMADVPSRGEFFDWDPVEDPQPETEPDVVLRSPRPRVLLSITQWVGKYWWGLKDHPSILRLEERMLVDEAALDYIWPQELEDQDPTRASSKGVLSRMLNYFGPSKARSTPRSPSDMVGYTIVDELPRDVSMSHAKNDGPTTSASSMTIVDEPPTVPVDIDRTIDNLLVLTQEPVSPPLEKQVLAYLQTLVPFHKKLRQRLEEMPNKLGPFMISSHVLRFAYARCHHLNWVAFWNLPPRVIAAAIASDELQDASTLSLCVNAFQRAEDADLIDLVVALAQSTGLQQLCFLQQPDQNDDVSTLSCSQLLRLWGSASGGESWEGLRPKTIYSTAAFLTGLRSHKSLTSSSTIDPASSFTSGVPVFPTIYLFTFVGPQREDTVADHQVHPARPGYSSYYSMDNTGLSSEIFAVRFLGYLRSLGPDSDLNKAILRVAYHGAFSSLASIDEDNDQYRLYHESSPPRGPPRPSPLQPSPDEFGVRPIPAGFFDDPSSRIRLGDIHPGSWVVLVDRRDRRCRFDNPFLQYCFMRIRHPAEITPEQQSSSSSVEMVGGLTDFLRETVPGTDMDMDMGTWENRVEEVERDLGSAFTRPSPASTPSSIDFATGEELANSAFRRLAEGSSTPPESDIFPEEEPVEVEVERERCDVSVGCMAESRAHTLLSQLL